MVKALYKLSDTINKKKKVSKVVIAKKKVEKAKKTVVVAAKHAKKLEAVKKIIKEGCYSCEETSQGEGKVA